MLSTAGREVANVADVFISYHVASGADVVRQIAEELHRRGISCWYSETGVAGGEDFAQTVPPQIEACKVFLLMVDEGATKSPHVENELGLAFKRKGEIMILPFRVEKCALSDWMRYYLVHTQIMDDRDKLIDRITKLVKPPAPKVDVFISYHVASTKSVVEKIGVELDKRGVSYWYSETGVYAGEDFALVIPPKIRECKVFLWILDQGAAESKHVRRELALADKTKEVKIIPFCLESIALNPQSEWTEYYLANTKKMDGQTPPLDKRMGELANYIAKILGKEKGSANTKPKHMTKRRLEIWKAFLFMIICLCFFIAYRFYQQHNPTQIEPNEPTETEGISGQWEREVISAGLYHTVGLRTNSKVVAVGRNLSGECNVMKWRDIVSVSAGYHHTVGLRTGGMLVAVGYNEYGQCNVTEWRDIAAVSTGSSHTVGLRKGGTVVAVGDNNDGQCDVTEWQDITAVSAGSFHTVGLRKDGVVVAVGNNDYGQCDVREWQDIVAISAGHYYTVGVHKDGTVVATGDNTKGQCNVSEWQDIVAVSAGDWYTVGLRKDGTVVAVGNNEDGQCNVSEWRDIVAVSAGRFHTLGLRKDSTVVAVGRNDYGQCNVSGLRDIQLP